MIDCSSCISSKDEICPANKGKCKYKSFYEVDSHNREEVVKVLSQHREHWKRLLTENICSKEEGLQTVEALDMAIKALEQEPKRGHWIMTSDYLTTAYGSIDYVKCSCCGEDSLEEGDYCPNCGAKMGEG